MNTTVANLAANRQANTNNIITVSSTSAAINNTTTINMATLKGPQQQTSGSTGSATNAIVPTTVCANPVTATTAILQPTAGILPTIMAPNTSNNVNVNERLNNSINQTVVSTTATNITQNHDPKTAVTVTTFTIHAPTPSTVQSTLTGLTNNLVSAAPQSQIQVTAPPNTIIHQTNMPQLTGNQALTASNQSTASVCTAAILQSAAGSAGHGQITTIPVGSISTGQATVSSTVLKAQTQPQTVTTIPVGQRFTPTASNTAIGPGATVATSATPINAALFIQQDSINPKLSTTQHNSIATTTVINTITNVASSGSTANPTLALQTIPTTNSPLFVQTAVGGNTAPNTTIPNSAISFHSLVSNQPTADITVSNSQPQQIPTNLTTISAINSSAATSLSTSSSVQQTQQQSPQQHSSATQPQFQRLKVEDALSYLDQVKLNFNDKPQVYNDFLDIMKEFKSQSIDTPGVIQRVSNLFKGHPELIVGFNTFLPPGYKIEIHANDQVNVSMPNATNVVLMSNVPLTQQQPQSQQQSAPHHHQQTQQNISGHSIHHPIQSGTTSNTNLIRNSNQASTPNPNLHQSHHQQPQLSNHHSGTLMNSTLNSREPISTTLTGATANMSIQNRNLDSGHNHRIHHDSNNSSAVANSRITSPGSIHPHHLSNQNNLIGPNNGVEFNHAISYVNKIKNRFSDQPEIYKQFLDILQNYQKDQEIPEQKLKCEIEVFSKVSKLFENQPDLLQEFSQFLPEAQNSSNYHNATISPHLQPGQNSLNSPNSSASGGGLSSGSVTNYAGSLNSNQATNLNYSHHAHHGHQTNLESSNYHSTTGQQQLHQHGSHHGHQANFIYANNEHHHKKSISVNSGTSSSVLSSRSSNNTNQANSSYQINQFPRTPRRSISNSNQIENQIPHCSMKRSKLAPYRDSSIIEPGKYMGDLIEYAFFDKLRSALNSSHNYEDFLKCLILFNNEILNRQELAQLVQPLFQPCPDLCKRFKEMLNIKDGNMLVNSSNNLNQSSHSQNQNNLYLNLYNNSYLNHSSSYHPNSYANSSIGQLEGLSNRIASVRERHDSDSSEFDYTKARRFGSYLVLPNKLKQKCSGATLLCREVLNDTMFSFPCCTESSETSSVPRKTQYEESMYRCEDERYELDLIIETNLATIRVLESVARKMEMMTQEEKQNFKLDNRLGGSSHVIHTLAIRRIYGENANAVLEGIKNSPANVIPLVLRRLISKDEEWRDAQKQFNRIWREQNEKYYLKSLDIKGIAYKQSNIKKLRSKFLLTEIADAAEGKLPEHQQKEDLDNLFRDDDDLFDQQSNSNKNTIKNGSNKDQNEEDDDDDSNDQAKQPHLVFTYPDKFMIDVACNLIIHHVKRQTSIHKEEKRKIKHLMRHFIPDLFNTPRGELSDDEVDEESKSEKKNITEKLKKVQDENDSNDQKSDNFEIKPLKLINTDPDDDYVLFMVNSNWYLFFRLHQNLCQILSEMYQHAQEIALEEKKASEKSPSILLRLRTNLNVEVDDYFNTLVDMVKQLLDGNLDSTQYEDTLREMFTINAYKTFLLDKIVQNIVRQLQHIVADEACQICTDLFMEASKDGAAGGPCSTANERTEEEYAYQRNFGQLVGEEHRFKVVIYKKEGKFSVDVFQSVKEDGNNSSNGDGDGDDSNVQNVHPSRTLRSTTKNMTEKERQRYLLDTEKLNDLIEENLRANPPFLRKYIRKHKRMSAFNNSTKETKVNNPKNENSEEQDLDDEKPPLVIATESPDQEQENNDQNDASSKESKDSADKENNEKADSENKQQKKNNDGECKFDLKNVKSLLVVQNETVLYRRNISDDNRPTHKSITNSKYLKFKKWYSKWVSNNCDEALIKKYDDWLQKSDTTGFKLTEDNEDDQDEKEDVKMEIDETPNISENDVPENKQDSNQESKKQSEKSTSDITKVEETVDSEKKTEDVSISSKKGENGDDVIKVESEISTRTETSSVSSIKDKNNKSIEDTTDTNNNKQKRRIIQKVKVDNDKKPPYRVYYKYVS